MDVVKCRAIGIENVVWEGEVTVPGAAGLQIGASVKLAMFSLRLNKGRDVFTLWPELG